MRILTTSLNCRHARQSGVQPGKSACHAACGCKTWSGWTVSSAKLLATLRWNGSSPVRTWVMPGRSRICSNTVAVAVQRNLLREAAYFDVQLAPEYVPNGKSPQGFTDQVQPRAVPLCGWEMKLAELAGWEAVGDTPSGSDLQQLRGNYQALVASRKKISGSEQPSSPQLCFDSIETCPSESRLVDFAPNCPSRMQRPA